MEIVEVTSRDTLEPTYVVGNFLAVVNELNMAAANGRSMVVFDEKLRDGTTAPVAVERINITRIRPRQESVDAFTP